MDYHYQQQQQQQEQQQQQQQQQQQHQAQQQQQQHPHQHQHQHQQHEQHNLEAHVQQHSNIQESIEQQQQIYPPEDIFSPQPVVYPLHEIEQTQPLMRHHDPNLQAQDILRHQPMMQAHDMLHAHLMTQSQQMSQHIHQTQPLQQDVPMIQQGHMVPEDREASSSQQHHEDTIESILDQLTDIVRKTQEIDHDVKQNRDQYQEIVILIQTRNKYLGGIAFAEANPEHQSNRNVENLKRELRTIEPQLRAKANDLTQSRRNLLHKQSDIFGRLVQLQDWILFTHLPKWHHDQQLMNNGFQVETVTLDLIQACVEKIVDTIWRMKNQIKGLQLTLTDRPNIPFNTEELENFVGYINKALETLIMNTLIVEKQPPQVMKTNTRFSATVRFLCGNKLNVQMINPTVKALILSEQNARTVLKYHKELIDRSWPAPDTVASAQFEARTLAEHAAMVQQPDIQMPSTISPHPSSSQQLHQSYDSSSGNHPMVISTDQSMSVVERHPTQEQFLQGHFFQPPYQTSTDQLMQHSPTSLSSSAPQSSGMVSKRQCGFIYEIGYNPDVPIDSKDFDSSGEIMNSTGILEYNETTEQMMCHFKTMQLKKIKRTEKKGTESVMDEKFLLLFFTEFRIADDSFWPFSMKTNSSSRVRRGDLLFHIIALSLPVVVIVHGNQEPHAWATVTWHNAFASQDEVLYKVPEIVPWRDLGNVLSEKFRACAGRGLTRQNLDYLLVKLYRNHTPTENASVTWSQFAKESLSDKPFTFWEWFHSILKLTKDHLGPLWKADRIFGFVGKRGCIERLLGEPNNEPAPVGTFLLRFSETELGGITIAWVASEPACSNPTLDDRVQISQRQSPNPVTFAVMHLQPFLSKDLQTRSLADRIRDLKDLVYLYPNIPKDEAFRAYYTPITNTAPKSNEGYVRSLLVTTLAQDYPGVTSGCLPQPSEAGRSTTPTSGQLLDLQSSPEGNYPDNTSMNESMDPSFSTYDPSSDYNYSLQ